MQVSYFHTCFLIALLVITGAATQQGVSAQSTPDLEVVRQRVIADLYAPPVDRELVAELLRTVNADGSWPEINYIDVTRTGFDHARHLDNMYELSRAYKKKDSPWYQNPEVRTAALSALDYWLEHDFICDNWWWNEIGTPGRMINTLLVLDKDLSENQIREGLRIAGRAHLEASGARPGGDLIQIAGMLGKQAVFRRDKTVLRRVVNVMAEEIAVTTGRGLKPDMSFHHRADNVICTLSYGLGYANSFADWAVKTVGTRYSFPEKSTSLLIDYFLDGICKSMVNGKYPDPGAMNRDLSRKGQLRAADATLAENLLKASNYRRAELEEIAAVRKGEIKPNFTWNRFFWHSEYFSHQRPGYFASVRMHSSRNHTMEQPHNEEGLKMHHVGDGSNFVSQTGEEYFDIFPVWDWQKIPGTTTVQKPAHPHWKQIAKRGLTDFVGAASDSRFGVVAMDFKSAHDPLVARKAWFFFDNEYVCLGTGVTSLSPYSVVTTLNQCRLEGEVLVTRKKKTAVLSEGEHSLNNVSWIWHNGVGYVFPRRGDVHVSNQEVAGTWRSINHQGRTPVDTVRLGVFGLWKDHGVRPENGGYEYIVVPASSPDALARYQKDSPVEVLRNNTTVQAVWHRGLERAQVVFYQGGKIKVNDHVTVTSIQPCVVMLKINGKQVEEITVSDPSRKLAALRLEISTPIEGKGPQWKAWWDQQKKEGVIDVNLPRDGYAGQSVVMSFPATPGM